MTRTVGKHKTRTIGSKQARGSLFIRIDGGIAVVPEIMAWVKLVVPPISAPYIVTSCSDDDDPFVLSQLNFRAFMMDGTIIIGWSDIFSVVQNDRTSLTAQAAIGGA